MSIQNSSQQKEKIESNQIKRITIDGRPFDLPPGIHQIEQFRSLASITDESHLVIEKDDHCLVIDDLEEIGIEGGEDFKSRRRDQHMIIAKVNRHPVKFHQARVDGFKIKETAIAQGVLNIQPDFLLFLVDKNGELEQISDIKTVKLDRQCPSEFRCVTPDDHS